MACGADGGTWVIRPDWWEAVQDIGQQQTRWMHAEISIAKDKGITCYDMVVSIIQKFWRPSSLIPQTLGRL
jgi:hypothetical protein